MYANAHRKLEECKYRTHASMIQSSGSGKSRLIDMVAETIFTIPFNIREARGDATRASELSVRDLITHT